MSITCTIVRSGRCDTYGRPLLVGQTYTSGDDEIISLWQSGYCTVTGAPDVFEPESPIYSKTVCNITTPWLYCPSSTVVAGAAGAAYITLGTALPAAIDVPGKCYVPAVGSMSAGWYDFSSATTTQVNLVEAVTTGGAFTATINADVAGPSYTISGGSLGPNGGIERLLYFWTNNSAGLKTAKIYFGASLSWSFSLSTSVFAHYSSRTWARNSTSKQQTSIIVGTSSGFGVNDTYVDFSSDVVISFTCKIATATDYLCLLAWNEKITYGA